MACFLVCIKTKRAVMRVFIDYLAEKVGFEPTLGLTLGLISSQVHSATLPLLQVTNFTCLSIAGLTRLAQTAVLALQNTRLLANVSVHFLSTMSSC